MSSRELFQRTCMMRGKKLAYTPEELMKSALEYFEWADSNPRPLAQLTKDGVDYVPKKRPYTVGALCLYLGITQETLGNYRKKEDYKMVTSAIDEMIRGEKLEGGMSGDYNASIVIRDLGLHDSQHVKQDVSVKDESDKSLTDKLQDIVKTANTGDDS